MRASRAEVSDLVRYATRAVGRELRNHCRGELRRARRWSYEVEVDLNQVWDNSCPSVASVDARQILREVILPAASRLGLTSRENLMLSEFAKPGQHTIASVARAIAVSVLSAPSTNRV